MKNTTEGTPKDLRSAIFNGFCEAITVSLRTITNDSYSITAIHKHVRDRLAQEFVISQMQNESNEEVVKALDELWNRIFPVEIPKGEK